MEGGVLRDREGVKAVEESVDVGLKLLEARVNRVQVRIYALEVAASRRPLGRRVRRPRCAYNRKRAITSVTMMNRRMLPSPCWIPSDPQTGGEVWQTIRTAFSRGNDTVGPDLSQRRGRPSRSRYFTRSGLLPGPHAMPGFTTCGSSPSLTSCPNDCEWPPGPFGAIDMSRLSGAVGSSFCPENTQIELACAGPAVGLPLPVTSPALAALALRHEHGSTDRNHQQCLGTNHFGALWW